MTSSRLRRCLKTVVWFTPLAAAACSGSQDGAIEDFGVRESPIINGTVPSSAGALVNYGVVSFGCTGTMLTNRHVLTAHHCTGRWTGTDWSGTLTAPGAATVTLETPTGVVWAYNSSFIEPPGNAATWTVDAGDYSIMVLDRPLSPDGIPNKFYNKVYTSSDASLVNKSVLCIGYGATFEATPAAYAGGYMLSSANMNITSASGGAYVRNRTAANVVGFGGDSGSTCFLAGAITGVQSTCFGSAYYDLNGNGKDDLWGENYNVQYCTSSAPSSFRTFVTNNIMASVTVHYSAVPPLPAGTTIPAVATSPAGTSSLDALSSTVISAPRSGQVQVDVTSEPAHMMCPHIAADAPMTGSSALQGTCLNEGLLPVLTNVN